jgi:hypothetical protein
VFAELALEWVTYQPPVARWTYLPVAGSIDVLTPNGDCGYRSGDAPEGGALPPHAAGT